MYGNYTYILYIIIMKQITITNRIRRILDIAISCAENSEMSQKHGAVLFDGNVVYNSSFNSLDKVFDGYTGLPSCHAEMNSLRFITNNRHRFEYPP